MEPELSSMDFVGKSGTNIIVCHQTNGNIGLLLHIKIVEPTVLGGNPWLLC